jgi:hypothetical protein
MTQDPELGEAASGFILQKDYVTGAKESGAICAAQGFGGYNAAIAMRSATAASISRYRVDQKIIDEYLERWPQIRSEREQRERHWRRRRGSTIELAHLHCWAGAK